MFDILYASLVYIPQSYGASEILQALSFHHLALL